MFSGKVKGINKWEKVSGIEVDCNLEEEQRMAESESRIEIARALLLGLGSK